MSAKTNIEWCDSTLNWVIGCTKVSPGCAHCYAEKSIPAKMLGIGWGDKAPRYWRGEKAAAELRAMNRRPWVSDNDCTVPGGVLASPNHRSGTHRRRIFHNSLSDWLDPQWSDEWRLRMLDGIRLATNCVHLLLTKRPERWYGALAGIDPAIFLDSPDRLDLRDWILAWLDGSPPPNVVVMTSVEDQQRADERIPALMKIPALCYGLSLEPLLGPVTPRVFAADGKPWWWIVGGESGKGARPCDVEWVRALLRQGQAAGVAVFVKQLGARPVNESWPIDHPKGGDPAEWANDLRVREWPEVMR